MHYMRKGYSMTAKGELYLLNLAVLFLFSLLLIPWLMCHSAQAIGVEIRLEEKDREILRFGELSKETGLTISSDSIPLLKTNLRFYNLTAPFQIFGLTKRNLFRKGIRNNKSK